MDREKALKILGLPDNASNEEITKRYNIIFKKFRQADKDEKGYTKEDVEAAYYHLMGIHFFDEEAERKKKARQERPNPIFKLLKVDEEKALNFIYYYKWKVLFGIIALIAAVSLIMSAVNRVDPDLKIVFAGEVYLGEYTPLENAIVKEIEGVRAPQVQVISLSSQMDAQMMAISQQKLSLELMEGDNDIFIMDLATYRELASLGAFMPLNGRLEELGIKTYDKEKLEVALNLEDGKQHKPLLYGVDVSNSPLIRDYGVLGETLIAALHPEGANLVNGEAYYKKLIESVQ